jgi:peptide methionine sulfoxide reductase MsrA
LIRRVLREASPHKAKAQYMSAVWANSPAQAETAKRVADAEQKAAVPVLSAASTKWHDAEGYHQKYVEKQRR